MCPGPAVSADTCMFGIFEKAQVSHTLGVPEGLGPFRDKAHVWFHTAQTASVVQADASQGCVIKKDVMPQENNNSA